MQQVIEIVRKIGFKVTGLHALSGGDISQSYCVYTEQRRLMLKLNDAAKYPGMFERESEGLEALAKATGLKVPAVVAIGEHDCSQYLCLEWMETGTTGHAFWEELALGLGRIHQATNPHFGWHRSNYIGSLTQENNWAGSWSLFYGRERIMPLVRLLFNSKVFDKNAIRDAEAVCNNLTEVFQEEPPSLLHGDLWRGNVMPVISGYTTVPAIFDPAVYYGHREMDLGMSLLFGGFNSRFYDCYEHNFSLEKQWRKRVSLTQLYPILVHAVLFGGSYVSRSKTILNEWR